MKIEELDKSQIILLTLLVSFVVSIATGIVTVSLMERAPAGVTQTINRVVERTVERVVPTTDTKQVAVMSDNEQLIASIEKVSKNVVRIVGTSTETQEVIKGLGVVVSKNTIIADKSLSHDKFVYGTIINGKHIDLTHTATDTTLAQFKSPDKNTSFGEGVTFEKADALKLGQMVFAIGGLSDNKVSVGMVKQLVRDPSATTSIINFIETDINIKDIIPGSPLVTIKGAVVGFSLSQNGVERANSFVPISVLKLQTIPE